MNLCEAERRDRVMTENWKEEMSEIVVFVSAVTFVVSYPPISKSKCQKGQSFLGNRFSPHHRKIQTVNPRLE
jgi:hypothetical protein